MIRTIQSWWNKKDKQILTLERKLIETIESNAILMQQLEASNQELKTIKEAEDFSNRITPYFELKSESADPVKGLAIEMDWNEAFIQHLREHGHVGRTDNILIQKWLAMLYENMIETLEQQIIDSNSSHIDSEFK